MANQAENVTFLTVGEFKTKLNISKLEVLKNPNTGKLFLAGDNGQNYKCQGDIDGNKEMRMLVPESGDLSEACLTNVKPGAEKIFTL